MAMILDASGAQQQIAPTIDWYRAAADEGLSLEQHVNRTFQTAAGAPSAYRQILASEGICIRPDKEFGIHSTRLSDMMDNRSAGSINKDSGFSSAALRTLFPSVILTAIEDRLKYDYGMNANAFDSIVAITDTIQGDKFERPLLNFSSSAGDRSRAITQLAEPVSMMTITTSSISKTIPALGIGMTISDQAKQATTLDLVSLAMARQVEVERAMRADEYFLQLKDGDLDVGTASLSSLGYSVAASTLDAAATAGLTQLAWMKWLYRNSKKRKIDWIITDLAGAMAIESRTGKPVTTGDNPNSPRIDSLIEVGNPTWNAKIKVFITDDANWPAKTIMGVDSRYGIHRVTSSTIAYSAVEQFVMRRAESFRVDFGEIVYRLFDESFDVMTYA